MNKGELIKAMADKAGFSQKDASIAYESFIEIVTKALKAGDKVQRAGFGTFEVKESAAKTGICCQPPEASPSTRAPFISQNQSFGTAFVGVSSTNQSPCSAFA